MAFTFAINNYHDAKSDKINPRRKDINAIASGQISRQLAIILLLLLVLIPLIISSFYRLEVFVFCVYLLFSGWIYSAPPIRLKNIPVVDVFWHFLGFFSYILWGSLIAGRSIIDGSIGLLILLTAISIGIFSMIGQVGNHINDYTSDKETGTMTFAVWAGLDNSKITINFLTLLHLIVLIPLVLLYTVQYYASIIVLIVIAFLGLILLKPRRGMFPSKNCWTFYFAIVLGGGVYLSILIYHIYTLFDIPPLEILTLLMI
jgi:4-hydroxybenzoate polyprenyltransferase